MCYNLLECVTIWDIFSLILGIVLSAFTAIFIIRFFRPRICIGIPTKDGTTLKIPVRNDSKCFAAVNLRIEAAAVLNDQTYHLDFDRIDFLMLLRNKTYETRETPFERTYHAIDVDEYTKSIAPNCQNMNDFFNFLNNNHSYLRVRVHAYHEFTGFGKAFQAKFNFINNVRFEPNERDNNCRN
ncbi:MAG: hypothetical protein A2W85_03690 [Bacteroidetes bacterium GWF2_41_31]|nr:MAG: hypothetical protein A2W85_03690 [Bacteroidetes bacterium GWF2_41_31]